MQIVDYFDLLINQVDLKAETLLMEKYPVEPAWINVTRSELIDEIKRIEAFDLQNLSDGEAIFKKFAFFIDRNQLSGVANEFGYIVKIGRFVSSESLNFFRAVLKLSDNERDPSFFFKLNPQVSF